MTSEEIIKLANLINLQEMARKREELAKAYRLALWLKWNKGGKL